MTKQPVLELKGDTCVDITGFGISTNYSGKIVEKNICEFSDMSPSIIEGVPFSISIVSPFSGKMSVVELLNSETNIIISDLDVIAEKSYTIPKSGMLELTDQEQLTLEILFSGSGIKYSRIINFDVIPANSD